MGTYTLKREITGNSLADLHTEASAEARKIGRQFFGEDQKVHARLTGDVSIKRRWLRRAFRYTVTLEVSNAPFNRSVYF